MILGAWIGVPFIGINEKEIDIQYRGRPSYAEVLREEVEAKGLAVPFPARHTGGAGGGTRSTAARELLISPPGVKERG
jgi:hypothetical protein